MGLVKDPVANKAPVTDSQITDLMIRHKLTRPEAEYVADSTRTILDPYGNPQAGISEATAIAQAKARRNVVDPRTGTSYVFPTDDAYEITDSEGRHIRRPGSAEPILLKPGQELYGLKPGTYIRRAATDVSGDVVGHDCIYVVNTNGTVTRKGIVVGGTASGESFGPLTFTPTAP